jgi:hypothetical protein
MLHAEQGAEHVSIESGAIAFSVLIRHRTRLPFGPGIVDSDVEATEAGDSLIDQGAHIVFVAYISVDEFSLHAKRPELCDQRNSDVVPAPGNHEGCAFASEC